MCFQTHESDVITSGGFNALHSQSHLEMRCKVSLSTVYACWHGQGPTGWCFRWFYQPFRIDFRKIQSSHGWIHFLNPEKMWRVAWVPAHPKLGWFDSLPFLAKRGHGGQCGTGKNPKGCHMSRPQNLGLLQNMSIILQNKKKHTHNRIEVDY